METGGRGSDTSPNEGPHPMLRDSHLGGISKVENFSLMSEGLVFHVKHPKLSILHKADEPTKQLTLKTNGDYIGKP